MSSKSNIWLVGAALVIAAGLAQAGPDSETTKLFKDSSQSSNYFHKSYGYAVFPTIGKGGIGIGAAHGSGHVYAQGKRIGNVTLNQLSVGFQLGGKAFSEIIFFKDKAALDDFTSGHFEFSADAAATAITASANVSVGTTGADAGTSLSKNDAATAGEYTHGMAVFTIAKGGLMYNATVGGQKFSYTSGGSDDYASN
jgi:lipid-binding SYLF domain-containing protein